MNQCKICSSECSDKATYCGPACRKKASRSVTPPHPNSPPSVTSVTDASVTLTSVTSSVTRQATRTNPDLINHGKPLSPHGLKKAGLKANRVAIPGDHDYSGVCVEVDGKWQARA